MDDPALDAHSLRLHRLKVLAAFAAVYFVWGSTYLAIRFVMDTLPDISTIGIRFFVAGVILYAFAWSRGRHRATARQWRGASLVGVLLLLGGNASVVWSMQSLSSGLAALLVAMEPIWLAILMWILPGIDVKPGRLTFAALGLGFAGAAFLAAPGDVWGRQAVPLAPVVVLTFGGISWAYGSLISRGLDLPPSPWTTSAIQMMSGGAAMIVFGVLRGEWAGFDPQAVSAVSVGAFFYLVVCGSLVAFSSYSWLIRTVEPTLVATHTYVNPVVAIYLGWWLADETVGPRTLAAAVLILSSVVILTGAEARRARRAAP